MRHLIRPLIPFVVAAAVGPLAGCGGGGGSSAGPTSTVNVSLMDAPASLAGVQSVFVTVTGVEVQPATGASIMLPFGTPQTVDLLTLTGGNVAPLVNTATVPAGNYQWLRLALDTSAGKNYALVCAGGAATCASPAQVPLNIPSGAETGLKVVRGFTMPVNGAVHLVVDFNVARSLVALGNGNAWQLKPVLRVVETDSVGSIAGTISAATLQSAPHATSACSATNPPTVYVYAAQSATTNVVPDDLFNGTEESGETDVQPVTTQVATWDAATGTAHYDIQWLVADSGFNEYTVAFTCDPDSLTVDESAVVPPATGPAILFTTAPQPVAVTAGATTTVNF
jgi:hypothetical protein